VEPSRLAFFNRDLGREQLDQSNWKDWSRSVAHPTHVANLAVDESPRGVTLSRDLSVPGIPAITQRIQLSAHEPLIRIEVELDLPNDPSPYGIYLALPLSLDEGWRAAFDTAGEFVELDSDQLPAANRGWPTIESVAMMWDAAAAVALLSPDAPSAQFGALSFGPPMDAVERASDPMLLSWISNNYWDTNYPLTQAGRHVVRYGLLTLPAPDAEAIRRHVTSLRSPLLTWPVTTHGRAPARGTLGAR
jgi:hypothetical protein